jgi:GNAT acetyltransferase-like protein
MDTRALTAESSDEWDEFAKQSDDAWFWHTSSWLEFAREMGQTRSILDLSFFLTQGTDVLAICPVMLEEVAGYRQFSYLGEFITFPAFRRGLPDATRQDATDHYVGKLGALAREHDVASARVVIPALAPVRLAPSFSTINPLTRSGFLELPAATQVIDLARDAAELRGAMRKGHRADVTRASRDCDVSFWDAGSVTEAKFREYQELHRKDAGRVTRSQRSFDLMLQWIRNDNAVLVEATHAGTSVAFALVMIFGTGAYYGSSCKDPDQARLPSSHLIQWKTMLWLKDRGVRHYDLGPQYFGPQWHRVPTTKDISIASFKRGFGGQTLSVPMAEMHYSKEAMTRSLEERFRALGSSSTPMP